VQPTRIGVDPRKARKRKGQSRKSEIIANKSTTSKRMDIDLDKMMDTLKRKRRTK
jgi:hypothetical protein